MSNYMEGTLKIRCEKEDAIRLFNEVFRCTDGELEMNEYFISLWCEHEIYDFSKKIPGRLVGNDNLCWDSSDKLILMDYECRWEIDAESFQEFSKKYNLHMKIVGFECGRLLEQHFEVKNGIILENYFKEYDDFMWECPCPIKGG